MDIKQLKDAIRHIPDWPEPGVSFKDITTMLRDSEAFRHSIKRMAERYRGRSIDVIASMEARGFIFGSALAYELGVGFIPIRKKGKLPWETVSASYSKEYGEDSLHMHKDAIKQGDKVLLVDDLLATGGTMKAAAELVRQLGGEVAGMCFLIELDYLKGRELLSGFEVHSLIQYDE